MTSDFNKKGKRKKEKEYLSVIFVPHSHDNVKVFKFSAVKSKLFMISTLVLTTFIIVGLCIFTVYTIYNNQKLKTHVENLTELNVEQKNMLSDKASEIKDLKARESSINTKINEFSQLYKEITDDYIEKSDDTKTNRSGDRNERTFVNDISQLKDILNGIDEAFDSQSQAFSTLADTEQKLEKYIGSIPTLFPTKGRISSKFGSRLDPFRSDLGNHKGIDIAADYGENILAAGDGVVILADWYSGYGRAVIIDHGHGITTLYGHTSEILVKEGKKVKKGDKIAKVGSSGRSTGPHLHFEVRINGEQVDPLKYLDS